jgi:hypothetical protein
MTPTPGADEGRARMFAAARARGAEAFSQIVALLPYIEQQNLYEQARDYVRMPGVVDDALRTFQERDGVSYRSISRVMDGTSNTIMFGEVGEIMSSFWKGVARDLQLGVYGEKYLEFKPVFIKSWSTSGDADDRPAEFFSYDTLLDVTSQLVAVDQKVRELQGWLLVAKQRVEQGDRAGEQAAMKEYMGAVASDPSAKIQSISPLAGQILTLMARAIIIVGPSHF